ncbi:hypothetical protein SEEPBA42_14346 [Salmonella enterica subsp. enterica serovar Paratyphi B str. SARA42]|nr:hypothetical protein SEEPBA42_14346 [Salmonella enterica subsp. enterica serovar Paratyphi B str. SARA42]
MYLGLRHQKMWRVYCQVGVVRRHLFTPGFSRSAGMDKKSMAISVIMLKNN